LPVRVVAVVRFPREERKVRTPQSSVPDNVREAGFKPVRRKVPQKRASSFVTIGKTYQWPQQVALSVERGMIRA